MAYLLLPQRQYQKLLYLLLLQLAPGKELAMEEEEKEEVPGLLRLPLELPKTKQYKANISNNS